MISQRVNQMSITDPADRLLRRLIFSSGEHIEIDKVGRILIPRFLRQAAELEDETVIVGVGDYFEVWSPSLWSEQLSQLGDSEANSQRFAAFDLFSG
jgi:MraZ protein